MHLSNTDLAQYFDQAVTDEERVSIERHAASCESCGQLMRCLAQVVSEITEAPAVSSTDSPGVEAPALPLVRGMSVGRYLLLERLGGGGMGVVYAAFDPTLDRTVALKFMRESVGSHRAQHIAEREAKAMARLSHPNVVGVFEVGRLAGRTFLALEHIEGSTLAKWLPGRSAREIGEAFLAAGRGLEAVHAAGLVHGDFKPANVLVDKQGRLKVSDFGLAREAAHVDTLSPGAGTAAYMAPEVRDGGAADALSDQFSFGTAFVAALLAAPSGRLQRRLSAIGARATQPNRSKRYVDFAQLLRALERVLAARRLSFVAIGLSTMALVAVACAGVLHARQVAPCQGLDALMTDTWSPARRATVAAAFEKSQVSSANAVFASAARTLDDYAARWSAQRTDACRATHVRADQSTELLDLRVDCLERRRLELAALVAELERAEKNTVTGAVDLVAGLEPLARCEDRRALLDRAPWPNGAPARAALEAAWQQIALAKAARAAGRFTEKAIVDEALRLARATHEPHLEAEALVVLADFQNGPEASASAWLALSAAEAGRNDFAKAQALVKLLQKEVERPPEQRRLNELIALARATVARAGSPPLLVHTLDRMIGSALRKNGQVAESIEVLRGAVSAGSQTVSSRQLAATYNALGVALLDVNRYGEAVSALDEAKRLYLQTVGPDHTLFAQTEVNLGAALNALDRFDEAQRSLSHAQGVYEKNLARPNAFLPGVMINLSDTHLHLGQVSRGLELAEQALALYAEASGERSAHVALAHTQIAQALSRLQRSPESLVHLTHALSLYETFKGADHPELLATLQLLGVTMTEVHDFTSAEQVLRRGQRIATSAMGEQSCTVGQFMYLLGRMRRLSGQPSPALFDAAIARCSGQSDGADVTALSTFERARASNDTAGAQQAFEVYAARRAADAALAAEMSQWLTARKRPVYLGAPGGK